MPGRRGASEQNSSRGPAMHPTAGLNRPNTFADLTVGCALSGRPAPAIGWQVPCTCGPRPRPVLRVTSTCIRAPSLASLLASLKHLHAHVHGERPPSRGVPCQVSPIAQYAVSWRMLTRDKLRGQAGQWSPTRSVGRRQSQRPQADQGSLPGFRAVGRVLDAVSDGVEALFITQGVNYLSGRQKPFALHWSVP